MVYKYQPFTYLPRKSFNQTFWKGELILEYSPTKVGFEKLRSEMISLLSRGEKSNHSFFSDLSLFKAHNKVKRYKIVNSSTSRQINHKPHQKWHQLVWRDYSEHQSKTLPSFWWPFLAKELSKGHFRGVTQNQIYKIIMAFIFHSRC